MVIEQKREIERIMDNADYLGINISGDFGDGSDQEGHKLQRGLIRQVGSLYDEWGIIKTNLFLVTSYIYPFDFVRQVLSNHPFSHVIRGKIASVIQDRIKRGGDVPPEFMDDYYFFDFKPWNNPGLQYDSLKTLRERYGVEAIPPEFR